LAGKRGVKVLLDMRLSWRWWLAAAWLWGCLACQPVRYPTRPGPPPPPPPAAPEVVRHPSFFVNVGRLNLRAGPGMDFPKIASLDRNDEVEKMGEAEDWFQVRVKRDGTLGWVNARYLSTKPSAGPLAAPSPAPPPVPPPPAPPAASKPTPPAAPPVAKPPLPERPKPARPEAVTPRAPKPAEAAEPPPRKAPEERPAPPEKPAPAKQKPKEEPPAPAPEPPGEKPSRIRIM